MAIKRLAILQSSYIPWKGYFDIIRAVDHFILYDDAQYTKNDWRNRNRIKTAAGPRWLTIPVRTEGRFGQAIKDVEVADTRWAAKHWKSLVTHYAKARFSGELFAPLSDCYTKAAVLPKLGEINELFIRRICGLLGIETSIARSMDYNLNGDRVDRLIGLCQQVGASEYLSGPAAKSYLDETRFNEFGIAVRWMDYAGYPPYPQLHSPPFLHDVTVLDLLLNVGLERAEDYLLAARTLP